MWKCKLNKKDPALPSDFHFYHGPQPSNHPMTFLEKQQGICLNQDARRSGTAEYIFLNKFFPPPCNIQNSDRHAGPAGSSTQGQHPLLATPWLADTPSQPYSFTLSSPGGGEAGGGRTPFLWYVPASIQPFLVWSSASVYTHTHTYELPHSPPPGILLLK